MNIRPRYRARKVTHFHRRIAIFTFSRGDTDFLLERASSFQDMALK